MFDLMFFVNSVLLGVGLAMDAFSVSVVSGMKEPGMSMKKGMKISGVFAFFQAAMPMLGWLCVHTVVSAFASLEKFIPWITLILLCFIGGKMIYEGVRGEEQKSVVGFWSLIVQGLATSIDALSTGFIIAEYNWFAALICSLIIAAVTFVICFFGVLLGKKIGGFLAGKASIFGGIILIAIGIECFISGLL